MTIVNFGSETTTADGYRLTTDEGAFMQYFNLDNGKLPLSRIILGTATGACCNGENCDEVFNEALKLGVTTFDTARVYGRSEEVIGDWLERTGNREKVNLLSKGGHHTPLLKKRVNRKEILSDLEVSLQKLKTDYIDIYLLHRDDKSVPVGELVETLNEAYTQGKIKAFGGSNWTPRRLEQANEYAYQRGLQLFTISSPYYGLADMKESFFAYGLVGLTGKEKQADRLWYQNNQMPVVAYSTLGNGLFSGKVEKRGDLSPFWVRSAFGSEANFQRLARAKELAQKKGCTLSQIAIAWSLHSSINVFPIIGTSRAKHLRSAVEALQISLSEEEYAYLSFIK